MARIAYTISINFNNGAIDYRKLFTSDIQLSDADLNKKKELSLANKTLTQKAFIKHQKNDLLLKITFHDLSDVQFIARRIQSFNINIIQLDFSKIVITDTGASQIVELLQKCPNLQALSFGATKERVKLDLSTCSFEKLEYIEFTNVKNLALPNELHNLRKLVFNALHNQPATAIDLSECSLPKLESISYKNCAPLILPPQLDNLTELIFLESVYNLDLSGCSLQSLKRINFSHVGGQLVFPLQLPKLEELVIS